MSQMLLLLDLVEVETHQIAQLAELGTTLVFLNFIAIFVEYSLINANKKSTTI